MHDSVTLQMLHGLGAVVLLLVMRSCDDMMWIFAKFARGVVGPVLEVERGLLRGIPNFAEGEKFLT